MKVNRIISKISACAAALCMIFGNAVISGGSHDAFSLSTIAGAVSSGTCGETLTWELSDGTLTISGTGDMYDYDANSNLASFNHSPFFEYRDSIKSVIIKNGVESIGDFAFDSIAADEIIIPNSVISIGFRAFSECTNLKTVSIPSSVTSIGRAAFGDCKNLVSVIIPDSVTELGDYIFSGCFRIRTIGLPRSIKSLKSVFLGYESIDSVKYILYAGTKEQWDEVDKYIKENTIDSLYVFYNCGKTDFEFEGTELIKCTSTSSTIEIPIWVTEIASDAFNSSAEVTDIILYDNIKKIATNVFSECNNLKAIYYENIPYNWKKIDNINNIGISNDVNIIYPRYVNYNNISTYAGNDSIYTYDILFVPKDRSEDVIVTNWKNFEKVIIEDGAICLNLCFTQSFAFGIEIPNSVTSINYIGAYLGSEKTGIGSFYKISPIYGYSNSYAEVYANNYGYEFIPIGVGTKPDEYTITIPDDLSVSRYGYTLSNNDVIRNGDILDINFNYTLLEGKEYNVLVNGNIVSDNKIASYIAQQNHVLYRVNNENVEITYTITDGSTIPSVNSISGVIDNFSKISGIATIQLLNSSGIVVDTVRSIDGSYSFNNINENEKYKLRVAMPKCAPRGYEVNGSSAGVIQNIELRYFGDSDGNGLVEAKDAGQILRYEVGLSNCFTGTGGTIDEYAVSAANVLSEDGLNARDATQILRHDAELTSIFDTLS